MTFFLDTNICIYALKGRYRLGDRMCALSPDQIAIPSIVEAELLYGAAKSERKERTKRIVQAFLAPFSVVGFGSTEAAIYADMRASLESCGQPVGPNDLIIAAIVLAHGGTLVTHNTNEFSRVAGLRLEDWATQGADP